MAERIGVRELKNSASQVIRKVREEMAEYVVTLHGEPVAIVRPLSEEERQRLSQAKSDQELVALRGLAGEIGAAWSSEKTAVDLVSEQRR